MAPLRVLVALALAAVAAATSCESAACGADAEPDTAALLQSQLRAHGASRRAESCDDSGSRVIQAVKKLPKKKLVTADPFTPDNYEIVGMKQSVIAPPEEHCKKDANDFAKEDFDKAWSYLSCALERLFQDPSVEDAFNLAVDGLKPVVYNAENPPVSLKNPWLHKTPVDFLQFFEKFFTFLPAPFDNATTGDHSGLYYILWANYFCRENPAAWTFLNTLKVRGTGEDGEAYTTEVFNWMYLWLTARGMFMDSPASLEHVGDWVKFVDGQADYVHAGMAAYKDYDPDDRKGYGYRSFNQFFARTFKNQTKSRPVSQEGADMVVTAPGDVEINFIINKLTLETKLPVKGDELNVREMLNGSPLAKMFVGGTAVSNVLMPYAYHNFHAAVSGYLVETRDVPGYFFGIPDGAAWFGFGNTGGGNTMFNTFSSFHRRIYIYNTTFGYVAQVAVGLADVNSICSSVESTVDSVEYGQCTGDACHFVRKGDPIGFFLYGGSLNILLFEAGMFSSMNVLMGNRIGSMNKAKRLLETTGNGKGKGKQAQ